MKMDQLLLILDVTFNISRFIIIPSVFLLTFLLFKKEFKLKFLLLLTPLFIFVFVMLTFPFFARESIKHYANSEILYFNVEANLDKDSILQSIKNLNFEIPKNSHPTGNNINIILVTEKGRKELFIRKDIYNKKLFWLYDKDYSYSKVNNIGYLVINKGM